jgi:hypothetical protein
LALGVRTERRVLSNDVNLRWPVQEVAQGPVSKASVLWNNRIMKEKTLLALVPIALISMASPALAQYGVPAVGRNAYEMNRYCQNRNYKVRDGRTTSYGGRCVTGREISAINNNRHNVYRANMERRYNAEMEYERTPEGRAAHQRFLNQYDWSTLPVRCSWMRSPTGAPKLMCM